MRTPTLRIAHKLGLAALAFLAPVAYLLCALVAQQNIAIDFADKERVGTLYLRGLWPVQQILAAATGVVSDAHAIAESVGYTKEASGTLPSHALDLSTKANALRQDVERFPRGVAANADDSSGVRSAA